MNRCINRAQQAANQLIGEFESAAAINTANYQLCEFILAAANLAKEDLDLAQKIGARMRENESKK